MVVKMRDALDEYLRRLQELSDRQKAQTEHALADFESMAKSFGFEGVQDKLAPLEIWTRDKDNYSAEIDITSLDPTEPNAMNYSAGYRGTAREFDGPPTVPLLDRQTIPIVLWPDWPWHLNKKTQERWLKQLESACPVCGCRCEVNHKTQCEFLKEKSMARKRYLREQLLRSLAPEERIDFARNDLLRRLFLEQMDESTREEARIEKEIGREAIQADLIRLATEAGFDLSQQPTPPLTAIRLQRKRKETMKFVQVVCDTLRWGEDIRTGATEIALRNVGAARRTDVLVAAALCALLERDGTHKIPPGLATQILEAAGCRERRKQFSRVYRDVLDTERILLAHAKEMTEEYEEERRFRAWLGRRALRALEIGQSYV